MNTTVRRSAVVVLLVLSVACGSSGPTSPSGTGQPPSLPPAATQRPPINFAPSSGPSHTFIFGGELSYRVTDYTRKSRVILYENGAFVLQYDPILPGEEEYRFRGQYHDANGVIMFMFAWEGPMFRPSDATGTLKGDALTVRYEEGMHHADFEDAVYVLMP